MLSSLAHQLTAHGFSIARMSMSFGLLNPSLLAAAFIWRPERPIQFTRFGYERRDSGMYESSPFKVAYETKRWVHIDLANTADEAFGIVAELRAEGIAHYYAIPLLAVSGDIMSMTIATQDPNNFSDEQRAIIEKIVPALTVVAELKMLRSTFREVLSAYVGRGPAEQIIDGTIHRGEVTPVRAAILVADLRGFTHLSTQLPPADTADVINAYYDVVVPQVTERGGEVLKFIGDAVLAVFPAHDMGDEPAVLAALEAARAALDTKVEPYARDGRKFAIKFGIAIHFGEAVYGNVGSGDRLDFTVIGRDVNIAARIAALCSRLGRDYLVSDQVAQIGIRAGRTMTAAGTHEVRGLAEPLRIYVPDETDIGPEVDDGISQGLTLSTTN